MVINWLAEESDTRDTLLRQSTGSNGLPRQPYDKLSDADDHRSTLRTDVIRGRMRSRSVTLERRRTAADGNAMSRRCRQMERSYSIDVMDPSCCGPESEKRSQRTLSNRDYRSSDIEDETVATSAVRPARSWMRASMRLVRPFHLADPPSPPAISQRSVEPVQIHLPPVFPCDIVERPCSAPTPERPRQYGRSGQRRLSSRVSSASSTESPATSFSASENWHVPASPTVSRTESRGSSSSEAPTITRNESVSSTTASTQSTNRPQATAQDDAG